MSDFGAHRAMLSAAPMPAFAVDRAGSVVAWNDAMHSLWGGTPQAGNPAHRFWGLALARPEGAADPIETVLRGAETHMNAAMALTLAGAQGRYRAHVAALPDGGGAVCFLEDIGGELVSPDTLLGAISLAGEVLAAQRAAMTTLGLEVGVSERLTAMRPLLADIKRNSVGQLARLLQLSLEEMRARQLAISEAHGRGGREDDLAGVAIDAFEGVMHRIRTRLDVALSCSEEIFDITGDRTDLSDVAQMSKETSRSVRMVLHYTHELNDLALLDRAESEVKVEAYQPGVMLKSIAGKLSRLAADAGVSVNITAGDDLPMCTGKVQVIERCLHYLILAAIDSARVSEVKCGVRVAQKGKGGDLQFRVEDNGGGASLRARAQTATSASMLEGAGQNDADGAGYAMARRLAKVAGGGIELSIWPGKGTVSVLTMPAAA